MALILLISDPVTGAIPFRAQMFPSTSSFPFHCHVCCNSGTLLWANPPPTYKQMRTVKVKSKTCHDTRIKGNLGGIYKKS